MNLINHTHTIQEGGPHNPSEVNSIITFLTLVPKMIAIPNQPKLLFHCHHGSYVQGLIHFLFLNALVAI